MRIIPNFHRNSLHRNNLLHSQIDKSMHARNCRPMTHALKTSLMQVSILETRGERHSLPPTMTVMQVMMQPFGIMNALRGKISVPISATAALAAALTAPKSTALYSFCGELTMSQSNSRHSRHFAEWWTLLVSSFMMFFSVTCFVLLETGRYEGIRAVFDTKPWQNAAPLLEDSDELTKARVKIDVSFHRTRGLWNVSDLSFYRVS